MLISLGIAAFIFALFFAALWLALPDSTPDLDRHLMIFLEGTLTMLDGITIGFLTAVQPWRCRSRCCWA